MSVSIKRKERKERGVDRIDSKNISDKRESENEGFPASSTVLVEAPD